MNSICSLSNERKSGKPTLGYAFTYLYAAIVPATGTGITLLLPDMGKGCFSIFVDYSKEPIRALHGSHRVVLSADKTGTPQRSVCAQRAIAFAPQPTTSVLEELRKELSWQKCVDSTRF